jgi:hypothetical protein
MGDDGPEGEGMFNTGYGAYGSSVAPDRLRRLFLQLLDPDPAKRPTAQQAAEELHEIENQ